MAQRYATVIEVRAALGPAFDAPVIEDAQIQTVLDEQFCLIGLIPWGECASVGSKYAAAHVIARSPQGAAAQGGGQGGLESGNSNGPASRTWAVTAAPWSDAWWASSDWGLIYLEYRKPILGQGVLILGATSATARPIP